MTRGKIGVNKRHLALYFYIAMAFVALPLLSPLRALGEYEPATVRNALLPPLLIVLIVANGVRVLRPRSMLQIAICVAFGVSSLVGIPNLLDADTPRDYLSHLFQLASAYVMIGVGWSSGGAVPGSFWRRSAVLGAVATFVATGMTLSALADERVGRLYTPAYGFIFVAAFGTVASYWLSTAAALGLVVSNKRGPIVSVVAMYLYALLIAVCRRGRLAHGTRRRRLQQLLGVSTIVGSMVGVVVLGLWAIGTTDVQDNPVAQAVWITVGRLSGISTGGGNIEALRGLSEGRVLEIESAWKSLKGLEFIVGSGAGWSVPVGGERVVHNIHFTPLSISAVFGMPFALLLYSSLLTLIVGGSRALIARHDLTVAERMAAPYLVGAITHSLFAYSLFIDLMVFFFAGVLLRLRRVRHCKASPIA